MVNFQIQITKRNDTLPMTREYIHEGELALPAPTRRPDGSGRPAPKLASQADAAEAQVDQGLDWAGAGQAPRSSPLREPPLPCPGRRKSGGKALRPGRPEHPAQHVGAGAEMLPQRARGERDDWMMTGFIVSWNSPAGSTMPNQASTPVTGMPKMKR